MRRSKFNAVRCEVDGIFFDSKKERDRYQQLKLLERGKEIKNLKLQPAFPLIVNGVKIGTYKADFGYDDMRADQEIVEDVKSAPTKTPVYRIKKKLVEALYGIKILET